MPGWNIYMYNYITRELDFPVCILFLKNDKLNERTNVLGKLFPFVCTAISIPCPCRPILSSQTLFTRHNFPLLKSVILMNIPM